MTVRPTFEHLTVIRLNRRYVVRDCLQKKSSLDRQNKAVLYCVQNPVGICGTKRANKFAARGNSKPELFYRVETDVWKVMVNEKEDNIVKDSSQTKKV